MTRWPREPCGHLARRYRTQRRRTFNPLPAARSAHGPTLAKAAPRTQGGATRDTTRASVVGALASPPPPPPQPSHPQKWATAATTTCAPVAGWGGKGKPSKSPGQWPMAPHSVHTTPPNRHSPPPPHPPPRCPRAAATARPPRARCEVPGGADRGQARAPHKKKMNEVERVASAAPRADATWGGGALLTPVGGGGGCCCAQRAGGGATCKTAGGLRGGSRSQTCVDWQCGGGGGQLREASAPTWPSRGAVDLPVARFRFQQGRKCKHSSVQRPWRLRCP